MPRLLADLQLLRDEPAEGMADDGGLRLDLADRVDVVICDMPDPLMGEDLRILLSHLDGVRVIGPARRESRVAFSSNNWRQFFTSSLNVRLDEIGYQGTDLRREWSTRPCITAEAPCQYAISGYCSYSSLLRATSFPLIPAELSISCVPEPGPRTACCKSARKAD